MNRLSRLLAIQTQLQSRRLVRAADIAEKFGISLRTVYRDIQALRDAGIPVSGEAGQGYSLVDGYTLPPVSFSEEEANALVTAAKFVRQNAEHSLNKHYAEALTKIRAVMRSQQKDRSDLLSTRISASPQQQLDHHSTILIDVQKAITNFRQLRIQYRSIYKDETTERIIEPLGLYFNEDKWVLIAYCQLRQDHREFRLDRVENLRLLDKTSVRAEEFDLAAYFRAVMEKYS